MVYKDILIITNELTEAPDLLNGMGEERAKIKAYQHLPFDDWYMKIASGSAVLSDYIYISPYPEGDGVPLLSMHQAEPSDPYCKYGAFFDFYIAPIAGTDLFGLYAKSLKLTDQTGKGQGIMENVMNNHTFNLSLTYSFLDHETKVLDEGDKKTYIVKAKKIKLTEVSIVNSAAYSLAGFNFKNIKNQLKKIKMQGIKNSNGEILEKCLAMLQQLNTPITMSSGMYTENSEISDFSDREILEKCLAMLQQLSPADPLNSEADTKNTESSEISNGEILNKCLNILKQLSTSSNMEGGDEPEEMKEVDKEDASAYLQEEPKEEPKEELKEELKEEPKKETQEEPKKETQEEPKEDTQEDPKEDTELNYKIKNKKKMDILKELIAAQVESAINTKSTGVVEVPASPVEKPNFGKLLKDLESPQLRVRNNAKKNLFLSALDLVEKKDDRTFLKEYAEKHNLPNFTFDAGKVKNTISSSFLPAVYTYLTKEVELDVYEQKDLFDIFLATKGDISMHQRRANGLAGEYVNAKGDIFDLNAIPGFVGSADIPLPIRLEGKADFISEGERPLNAISMFNAITCKFHYKLGITLPVTKEAELLDIYGIIPKIIQKIGSFFQRTKNEALVKCLFGVNSDTEHDINQTRLVDKLSHIAYSVRNSSSNTIKAYNRPLFLTSAQAVGKYKNEEVNFIEGLDPTYDNIHAQMTDMLRSKTYKFLDPNNVSESIFNNSQVRVILPLNLRKDFISLTQQVSETSYLNNFEPISTNNIIRSGGYYNIESTSNYHTLYSLNENKSLQFMFVDFNELLNKTAYKAARTWFIVIGHPDIPAIYHDTINNMKDYDFMMEDGVMTNYAFYQYYSFGFMNPYAIRKYTATYDINPNSGTNIQF